MVSVRVNGFSYSKDIYELIRVFFPKDEIVNVDKDVYDDYFIDNFLIDRTVKTKIYYKTNIKAESYVDLNSYDINKSKDKTVKNAIKKSIYLALVKLTGKELPWGILTGIRPTKIVHDLFEKEILEKDISRILTQSYMLNEEKSRLIMGIGILQRPYLYPIDEDKFSLYVGIPFCPTRCIYCSFASLSTEKFSYLVDEYVDKLIYELECIKELTKDKKINTVYIGGGTPTAIPLSSLERIIHTINSCFGRKNISEFTVEAGRPDTITLDVLRMLKAHNVDRISINPQTMNEKTLKNIGRNHTPKDIINAYYMSRNVGFKSINMDLIVGLPDEGVKEVCDTLKAISMLNPDNLTVHTLAVKRGSIFKEKRENYKLEEQRIIGEMLDETKKFAKSNFLEPYYLYRQKNILGNFENIGYSKKGHECIYNISIMEERESIIGAGVGSTTKIFYPNEGRIARIFNFKDMKEYLTRIDEVIQRKRILIGN